MFNLNTCRLTSRACKYIVAVVAILAFAAYEFTVWRAL